MRTTPGTPPPPAHGPLPPELEAVFERLAEVMRCADVELALAAMDADLLLREDLPLLRADASGPPFVADPAPAAPTAPSQGDDGDRAERLLQEVVDLLVEYAADQERALLAMVGAAAESLLVGVLAARRAEDGGGSAPSPDAERPRR